MRETALFDNESICTFNVGGVTCGVPVSRVREVVCDQPITPVPLAHGCVRGLINLRGQILSVIDVAMLMDLDSASTSMTRGRYHVVAEIRDELISLSVDEMGPVVVPRPDQLEIPPGNLQPAAARLIAAVARMPDQVVLLVHLDHVTDPQTLTLVQADND